MLKERLRCEKLKKKLTTAKEASMYIKDGMLVGTSGFTAAGYPKAVPLALAERSKNGEDLEISIITGASVGDELDGALSRAKIIKKRYPYQTNKDSRDCINDGTMEYCDMHLSHTSQWIKYNFFGDIDIALVEAVAITEEGGIIPSTSVGNTNVLIEKAKKVIVEINTSQPLELEGIHDIYTTENPPNRKPIPIVKANDIIGTNFIPCDIEKIVAIVETDISDKTREVSEIDGVSKKISNNLISFLENEVKGLNKRLLPLQSGVGSVANAVLGGLVKSNFENITLYSEVLQDSVLDLIDSGKVDFASATAITISPKRLKDFYENIEKYKEKIILRPQEISNNPEVIRRLGVISLNTAMEVDIYGNVNSTNVLGSGMINGIGGSGDYTRNAYLSIFTTVSIAKNGDISSIVPMVSHHDHTEHDVNVIVTEQGVADLRGLCPRDRAKVIIENCAHPDYKEKLLDYYTKALKGGKYKHTPHNLSKALSWHERYIKTGSMK
ncbi:MAG: acetyl-CoA hydrolase/transferase family protein [Firmicutes bacterium]|nr:acetyl-CoA hydrolase/transferase family protein [Bacillota bacterium]